MNYSKKIVLIIAVLLMLPFYVNHNTAVAYAATATPTFAKSSVSISGAGKTYQLTIKNTVKGSKYKWSSSDSSIVKITSKGKVTAVNKGTVTVKCKVTYPTKKTKTISCTVTVKIPAQQITINNAVKVNGSHNITMGETFKFAYTVTPVNTSDSVYWSIGDGDKDCVKVDNDGSITALKPGKVILNASTASSATAKSSAVTSIIVEVVKQTAGVTNVDIVNSNELRISFDSPIDVNTVIGSGKLLNSVSISLKKNTKNVLAKDPGTLTASLSSDFKTLIITSSAMFDGDYGISLSSAVKTTGGVAINDYTKTVSYSDTVGPYLDIVQMDESGMINIIKFSEPINAASLKVADNVNVVAQGNSLSTTCDENTKNVIKNASNYVLSEDKKSLSINLSKIITTDIGKTFSVTLTGIKDLSGNASNPFTMPITLRTDNSPKPQAEALSLVRSSYNTLTATFDRAISYGGVAVFGSNYLAGIVDANNSKKVNYPMNDTQASLIGTQSVTLNSWSGYNVVSSNTSTQKTFSVEFIVDKVAPVLQTYAYDNATGILSLTYNEEVNVAIANGVFLPIYTTAAGEIRSDRNVNYIKQTSTDNKVVKLKLNLTLLGEYTINLEAGFVTDSFRNNSAAQSVKISNTSGTTNELPGPYSITQSATNPSQVILQFTNMLDVNVAQTVSNYSIAGATIISAQVIKNVADSGATVVLTVADGSIDVTVARPITITGLIDSNKAYAPISKFTSTVELKENSKAAFVSATVNTVSKNIINLNYNEQIKGTISLKTTHISGGTTTEVYNTATVEGNNVVVILATTPVYGSYIRIDVLANGITDLSGNTTNITTPIMVAIPY